MNLAMTAALKDFDAFLAQVGDDFSVIENNTSLIYFAMSNNAPDARYSIVSFLLDHGVKANCVNGEGETLFHILFSRSMLNIDQTVCLCQRLIDSGACINQLDRKGRHAIQYLITSKFEDSYLRPLYNWIFSNKVLLLHKKNAWGKSPFELATSMQKRKELVGLMNEFSMSNQD